MVEYMPKIPILEVIVIKSLSVCMITCWYRNLSPANYGGNLIDALMRRGVSVKVVTSHCVCKYKYRGSSSLFDGKYCLVTSPFDSYGDAPNRSSIRRFVYLTSRVPMGLRYAKQCKDSDILHYQQSSSESFGELPLLTLLTQTTVPHKVVTIHDLSPPPLARLLHLHRVYNYADAVIVQSRRLKVRMLEAGIPEDKIHLVCHGGHQVDLKGLVRTRVAYFGEPLEYKGFFTLLKALRILRDQGIYADEAEQAAKNEARRNNVEDQIKWHGRLSEIEFDEKMQESVFTFAVYTEPVWQSAIITRAMMNGTPVIATSLGGSSEYLGDTGTYVPPSDPSALAFAMRSLLENRTLREDLGKMARQRALQYLSWDAIAEKTIQIYQSVIDT
jgi:glycosyltransferase involved in cell wall biosynthesis